jgi:hypothetical protein
MDAIEGIWRLVDSRAWDEGNLESTPYGKHPMGQIAFSGGRMLAALCNGDADLGDHGSRNFSSYGGVYTFDGTTLETKVDVASDPARIGGRQVRTVVMMGEGRMKLCPPQRLYGDKVQRRELIWHRIWRPGSGNDPSS